MMNRWEGQAENVAKRFYEMDGYILRYRREYEDYEDFITRVSNIMIVSDIEVFKKCYWEKDFTTLWIKGFANYYHKDELFLQYLRSFIGLRMTKKRLGGITEKWN